MDERVILMQRVAEKIQAFARVREQFPVLIGFDGFVDSIIAVVDKREDAEQYVPIATIARFGEKVLEAAGQSSNYELVLEREKLGGNGPIMANAMAAFGLPVQYIGALGKPHLHPVFEEFASRAECISIANPGLTDALEFEDGKLMLGKLQSLKEVNWQTLCDTVGEAAFRKMVERSRLIGMVNWTMLLNVDEIWRRLAEEILPSLPTLDQTRRCIFVDLADPEKRTIDDLLAALKLLAVVQGSADVVLGLNLKEAEQVATALGVDQTSDTDAAVESIARGIREALQVHGVVIHPRTSAALCWLEEGKAVSAYQAGPKVEEPKILTGGGDHFNAGFCLGWLAGLSANEVLCAGTATSGYYVANAASPTLDELVRFISSVPEPAE